MKVSVRFGDNDMYYYLTVEDVPVMSEQFTTSDACYDDISNKGFELDLTYDLNGKKRRLCKSCKGITAWSPSGRYCVNSECREFNDFDGATC